MTDWKHPHSILLGVIVGLMLDHHVFWLAAVVFGLGLAIGRTWGGLSRLARDGAAWLHRQAAAPPPTEPPPPPDIFTVRHGRRP
jgi:hypothetical protein